MNWDEYNKLFHKLELNLVAFKPLMECDKQVLKLVNAAIEEEREACIKLLEDFSQTMMVPVKDTWRMGLIAGANALRARGLTSLQRQLIDAGALASDPAGLKIMNKQAEQNGEEL
jgi:hypothetical protein